jgi:hypothetical protein
VAPERRRRRAERRLGDGQRRHPLPEVAFVALEETVELLHRRSGLMQRRQGLLDQSLEQCNER